MCPVHEATGDPRDIPCYRSQLILDIYKKYFTVGGWFKTRVMGEGHITNDDIDELAESVYRCTACKRCLLQCPMGIDHALVTHIARYVLSEIGIVPKALRVATREQLEGPSANTSAIPVVALRDTLEFLEEELLEITGHEIKFPVDKEGVDFVFFPAVSDYLLEAETLMGNAAVMYATGNADNWTIGTQNFDGINYGLFYSDWHLENIIKNVVKETRRLKGKCILIGECGHASRSAKQFVPVFGGKNPPPVINCMEFALDMMEEGKLKLNPDIIDKSATYHDPCNIARSGWIVEQPRKIIKSFIKDFVEMTPNGAENYCCGGGGGTVSIDEMHKFRMEIGGLKKAEQIRNAGTDYVIAPCANCKKQLGEIIEYHKLDSKLIGLHDLMLKAIEFK